MMITMGINNGSNKIILLYSVEAYLAQKLLVIFFESCVIHRLLNAQ